MTELNFLSKGIQMIYLSSSLRKQSQQSDFVKDSHLQVPHAHVLYMCHTDYQSKRIMYCLPFLFECLWLWTAQLTAVLSPHHHTFSPSLLLHLSKLRLNYSQNYIIKSIHYGNKKHSSWTLFPRLQFLSNSQHSHISLDLQPMSSNFTEYIHVYK